MPFMPFLLAHPDDWLRSQLAAIACFALTSLHVAMKRSVVFESANRLGASFLPFMSFLLAHPDDWLRSHLRNSYSLGPSAMLHTPGVDTDTLLYNISFRRCQLTLVHSFALPSFGVMHTCITSHNTNSRK